MGNVSSSACRRIVPFRRVTSRLLLMAACSVATAAQAAPLPTTTTLKLSAPSLAWHTPVTLTASVTANGAPVTAGSITFCDVSAPYTSCEDSAVVGSAQLNTKTATAAFTYIPAIGSHNYTAIFNATTSAAASTSPAQTLVVTGLYPTTTAIAATGNPSGYGLTATVVGYANNPPLLMGTVSFQDTSAGNFVLGTAALGTPTYAHSFVPAPNSPILSGNQPTTAAVADFNGDGIPDIAIRTSVDPSMYIMLGNGDGTFRAALNSPFPVGINPCINPNANSNCSVATGDFDNNGTADLAITSGYDNTVIILLGNGDGTFTPAPGPPIPINFPQSVKTGDFNNDGRLDLAVTDSIDNTVSIQLGNGDGTFKAAAPVPTGVFPYFTAIADFNQDGNADIAVTNNSDNTVSIFLGKGDGTFTEAPGSPIPGLDYTPVGIVAADFNKDGHVDLAVADYYSTGQFVPGHVAVLLGNGDGTFTAAPGSPILVGVYPTVLVAMDFDHDGITDLVVENSGNVSVPSTETLAILKGTGDGTFTQPYPTTPLELQGGQSGPSDLIAGDFNGDGATDVTIPNLSTGNTTILLNQATQTATASVSGITIAGTGTHYVDAVYEGDTSFAPSTSSTIPLQGSTVGTSLTLTANPIEQMITMPVTFTAQLGPVTSQPFFTTPSGTVTFFDQSVGTQLGTAPIGVNGQAVLTLTSIGPGVHSVTASYGGAPGFLASNSNAVSVQIDELRVLPAANNNTTILPGTTVVYTLQVQPQVATTFLYNVSLTASGLPAGATATFTPAALAAGASMTNVTMTVKTAATAMNEPPPSPFERLPLALGILIPLLGTKAVRRRLRQIPPFLGVALFAVLSLGAIAGLSGCSGAGLFAAKKVPYSITVTATEGTVQRTAEVPLAIQ
jgi:Bacterial Ig-like domain (group 3)/FG-GAP-like repeat